MRSWETEYDAAWDRIERHPYSPMAAFGWGLLVGAIVVWWVR